MSVMSSYLPLFLVLFHALLEAVTLNWISRVRHSQNHKQAVPHYLQGWMRQMQSWWIRTLKAAQPKPNLINISSNLLSAFSSQALWSPILWCLLDQQMMVHALLSKILSGKGSRLIQAWPSLNLLGSVAMSAPPHRGALTSVICIMDHTTWICWSDASLFCCVQNHWVSTETVVRSFCVNALAINTAVWVLTFIRVFKMEGNVSRRASTK